MPPASPLTAAVHRPTTGDPVWAEHYAQASGFRWWPCEELVRSLAGKRFGRVLEVGCGNGANLWLLAEHATDVVGVDGNKDALAAARRYIRAEREKGNVRLVHGDIRDLEPQGSVDAVVDVMVSQHFGWDEHRALYESYRRVLRPGGWLFVYHLGLGTDAGPTTSTWTHASSPLFPSAGQVCLPPREALAGAMAWAGFKVTAQRGVTRDYGDGRTAVYHIVEGEAE